MERERSSEESDALERSTKKFKDNHCDEKDHSGTLKLMRIHLGAIRISWWGISQGRTNKPLALKLPWRTKQTRTVKSLAFVKFELKMDLDVVFKGGPWFVGQQFLAIRKWEPEFKAEEATLYSVAVWIRLPGLPIEFYEPTILKKIGRAIGPVLRIDSFTTNGARGRFARLCLQIIIDQPLINTVKIAVVRSNVGTNTRAPSQPPTKNQMAADTLVCDQTGDPLENHTSSDADVVLEQVGKDVPPNPRDPQAIPRDANPDLRKDMKPSSTLPKPNHRKTVADRVVNHSVGWDQSPWLPKAPHNTNSLFCFGAGSSENDFSRLPLGKTSERENNSCGEVNYCGNTKGPDGDPGVVQCRGDGGMEEYLPVNRDQCTTGVSSDDGRGVVHRSKPILAFPNGSAKVSSVDVSAARASIQATPLRKIAECPGGNLSGAGDFAEENPLGETHRN
nr:hypothetical protein CFP56_71221 [Quercus suber]